MPVTVSVRSFCSILSIYIYYRYSIEQNDLTDIYTYQYVNVKVHTPCYLSKLLHFLTSMCHWILFVFIYLWASFVRQTINQYFYLHVYYSCLIYLCLHGHFFDFIQFSYFSRCVHTCFFPFRTIYLCLILILCPFQVAS